MYGIRRLNYIFCSIPCYVHNVSVLFSVFSWMYFDFPHKCIPANNSCHTRLSPHRSRSWFQSHMAFGRLYWTFFAQYNIIPKAVIRVINFKLATIIPTWYQNYFSAGCLVLLPLHGITTTTHPTSHIPADYHIIWKLFGINIFNVAYSTVGI